MPSLATIDLVIIFAYLILVIGVGLSFTRREETSEEFFLAGRKLTWPVIGFSLFASNIGTEHLVGLAGEGHRYGLVAGGYEWMASYCLIVLAFLFIPQYLATRIYTIPEFLERRFSLTARMYLSVYFTVMIVLTKVSITLYAGSRVIETFFGWDPTWVMWGIGIATGLYTALGGLAAVVYTDVLQAIILLIGAIVLTCAGLIEVGGWSGLVEKAPAGFLDMAKPLDHPEYPVTGFLLGNLFGGIFYWCMDQSIVQRALGARDIDQGRKGALFAGFLKILPVFLFVLPGVIAVSLFPDIEHDDAFPTMVAEFLPIGLKGLVLAGLLAALMSSLDSTLNAAATLVTRDFLVRFSRTEPSQSVQVWVGRITIAIIVVAGVLWAPVISGFETLWKYLQMVSAYMGLPMAAAVLTGILWKRATNAGALTAMISGILMGLFMMWDTQRMEATGEGLLEILRHPYLASFLHRSLVAFIISVILMVVVSLMTPPPPRDRVEGVCFQWTGFAPRGETSLISDYRLWMTLLFVTVTCLWITFG
jgi:SSS family solute:Na+ symporter